MFSSFLISKNNGNLYKIADSAEYSEEISVSLMRVFFSSVRYNKGTYASDSNATSKTTVGFWTTGHVLRRTALN